MTIRKCVLAPLEFNLNNVKGGCKILRSIKRRHELKKNDREILEYNNVNSFYIFPFQ